MVDEKEAQLIADIISTLSSENISMSCAKRVLKLVEEVLPIITKLNQFV